MHQLSTRQRSFMSTSVSTMGATPHPIQVGQSGLMAMVLQPIEAAKAGKPIPLIAGVATLLFTRRPVLSLVVLYGAAEWCKRRCAQ